MNSACFNSSTSSKLSLGVGARSARAKVKIPALFAKSNGSGHPRVPQPLQSRLGSMWLFGTTEVVPFPKSPSSGLDVKISAASTVVGTPVGGGGALRWHGVLRRAKCALLRMTGAVGSRSELVLCLRDLVLFLSSLPRTCGRGYLMPPLRGWGWALEHVPLDARNVKIPILVAKSATRMGHPRWTTSGSDVGVGMLRLRREDLWSSRLRSA